MDDTLAIPIRLPEIDHTNMIGFLNADYKLRRLDNVDDIAYLYDKSKEIVGGKISISVLRQEKHKSLENAIRTI